VIASGHTVDCIKSMSGPFFRIHRYLLEHHRDFTEGMADRKLSGSRVNMSSWMVMQLICIAGRER
jgi:hypothetical protein